MNTAGTQLPDITKSMSVYFSKLVRNFKENDFIALDGDSPSLYLGPIDWAWDDDDAKIDKLFANNQLVHEYALQCNQVEILLREAGSLVERALRDLTKYDELNVERFKTAMEFLKYIRIRSEELNVEEKDPSYWDGLAQEAGHAQQARLAAVGPIAGIISSYNGAIGAYQRAHDASGDVPSQQSFAAVRLTTSIAETLYSAQSQAANTLDAQSHGDRQQYETQSRVYQEARRQIAQGIAAIKLNEMLKPLGALNYWKRMTAIADRAKSDFAELYARLNAISIGLQEFYAVPEGELGDFNKELHAARTRIEGAVTWLRRASNLLAKARLNEQTCVVRITIEATHAGTSLLNELKATSGLPVKFSDDPSDNLITPDMNRVRVRGISATAEPLSGDAWLDIQITSPDENLRSVDLTLPPVTMRVGRVGSSASLNIRDVAGGRPITNRSPVGEWRVHALRELVH